MAKGFQHIIRIMDTDLDGTLRVGYALMKVRGVGLALAQQIVKKVGISPETRLGFISDTEAEKIEDIMRTPLKHGVPEWFLNRPKDIESENPLHLIGSDLVLQTKKDLDRLKKLGSWRGYRHAYGLKVRGQRTRTTGRRGKTMGVKKKRERVQ